MTYQFFLANFSIFVTNVERDTAKPMKPGLGLKYTPISLVPCGQKSWWKEINNEKGQMTIINFGICIDSEKASILAPNLSTTKNLFLTMYQCQPGFGVTCSNAFSASGILNSFFVFQSTINVKHYNNPATKISKE